MLLLADAPVSRPSVSRSNFQRKARGPVARRTSSPFSVNVLSTFQNLQVTKKKKKKKTRQKYQRAGLYCVEVLRIFVSECRGNLSALKRRKKRAEDRVFMFDDVT